MARSSSSAQLAVPDAKRFDSQHGLQSMQALGKHTKTSSIQILMQLQKAGALDTDYEAHQLKRSLQHATETHAKAMTPYGPVVQNVKLDVPKLKNWEICHPFAYIWYLTKISEDFRDVMYQCVATGKPLEHVVYADELVPGNSFRPEKSRTLMCIYWCFRNWPSWLLSRTFAWPCFSIIRSTIINDIPGGMSYIARVILRVFFPEAGE